LEVEAKDSPQQRNRNRKEEKKTISEDMRNEKATTSSNPSIATTSFA
jgi:hypothetical protein